MLVRHGGGRSIWYVCPWEQARRMTGAHISAVEIEEAISNLAPEPFAPQEFTYSFLEAFGNKQTTMKRLRKITSNRSDVESVLQTNNIHIKVAPAGKVAETLAELKASPATKKAKAKFVLAMDGSDFQVEDLNSGEVIVCDYPDFPDHFGLFLPLAGISIVKKSGKMPSTLRRPDG